MTPKKAVEIFHYNMQVLRDEQTHLAHRLLQAGGTIQLAENEFNIMDQLAYSYADGDPDTVANDLQALEPQLKCPLYQTDEYISVNPLFMVDGRTVHELSMESVFERFIVGLEKITTTCSKYTELLELARDLYPCVENYDLLDQYIHDEIDFDHLLGNCYVTEMEPTVSGNGEVGGDVEQGSVNASGSDDSGSEQPSDQHGVQRFATGGAG